MVSFRGWIGGAWVSFGFGFILAARRRRTSDLGHHGMSEVRRLRSEVGIPPVGLRLKSVTAVGAIRWGVRKGDAIIAAKYSVSASIESWVHGPRA